MGYLKFRDDIIAIVIFLVLPVIYLSSALFSGSEVLGSQFTDMRSEFFYTRFFGFNIVSSFSVPLWNPYIFSGMPFIATLHPAIFYPLNLIFTILPITYATNWSIALHLFLSGVFTYFLLKYYGISRFGSMVAGIVYTFSAPQIMHIYAGHLNVLTAMVWTPLMFLFLDRLVRGDGLKYGAYLSVTIAMQLLAGQPQYLFYSMIALSLYLFSLLIRLRIDRTGWSNIWPKALAFAGFILLGLALSAIQILPTMEMTRYSTRESLSYEWVSLFSFPPENLVTFIVPDFFGNMLNTPYWGKNYLWEMSAYVGIVPLLLAAMAIFLVRNRVVCFFSGLAVVSVILAFGKYTHLLKLLYLYVPGFNLFRGNSKFIFLTAFSLAVLSGFGADAVIKGVEGLNRRFRLVIICFIISLSSGFLVMYANFDEAWFRGAVNDVIRSGDFYDNPTAFMQNGFKTVAAASFRSGMLWSMALLISGGALLLLYSYGKLKEKALMFALLLIIVLDLFTFGMRYMVTFNSREVSWDNEVVAFLKGTEREPFRVVFADNDINGGMASGIESLSGYDTIMVKRYSEFINLSQNDPPDKPILWVGIKSVNKLTDLLNAKYLILPLGSAFNNLSYREVFTNKNFRVLQNLDVLPRAFIVHASKVVKGRDSIFREMLSPDFKPATSAIIEEAPENWLNNPAVNSPTPKFIKYSPNTITIDAYLNAPGLLVLGDVYYPGWKAFVDGSEAKIYKTNYVMRGVTLPEGRHTVEFRYDPLSYKIGWIISLTSLFFAVGLLIRDWRRDEKA